MMRQPLPTASTFPPGGRRLPPTGGTDSILDAMLEATFPSGSDSKTAVDRLPRSHGGGKRTAHSASPRPQRWRPVDAVKLAKSEVAQMEGQVPPLSARLRVTAPSLKDLKDSGSTEPSGLHDGFYDFAAAVVRPQPSARQYALQLASQLEERLRDIQASGAERIQGQETRQSGTLVAAERSQSALQACMNTCETFVKDTTTESKERDTLLHLTRKASGDAIQKLLMLTKACCRDLDDAEENKIGLEASLAQLDTDNTGLRHVMQQMLTTEGDLRSQNSALESEVNGLKQKLEDAHENLNDLTAQLNKAVADLEEMKAEQGRGRPTTDRCVSPMMRFSAFMMSTDQVPSTNFDGPSDGVPGWMRPESLSHVGGFKTESLVEKNPRRKTVSSTLPSDSSFLPGSHRPSARLSMVFPATQQRGSRHGSRSVNSPPESNAGAGEQEIAFVDHTSRSNTIVGGMLSARESGTSIEALRALNFGTTEGERQESGMSSAADSPMSEHCLEPSMLATSFPALLPFVDFHMLDPELPKTQADAMALNSEHLEKHLVMLQDDYKNQVSQNEDLQNSVDMCLERILVWIQAVRDSLQDISSNAIQQDVEALTTLRNAVQWLAKHPCKEWTSNSKQLDQVLQDHENELRSHLAMERPNDSEMEDLRKSISQQRQRIQELSDQLLEARASVGGNMRPQRRNLATSASIRRTSSFNSSQSTGNEFSSHVAVQCDLSTPAFLTETRDTNISSGSPGSHPAKSISAEIVSTDNDELPREPPKTHQTQDVVESAVSATTQSQQLGTSVEPETSPLTADAADEAAGRPPAQFQGGNLPQGKAASDIVAQEAKRMLLLRCPFVEAIDFTSVPASGRVLLHPPSVDKEKCDGSKNDDKLIGLKQLRAFILDVYSQKAADDARRSKISQSPRPLYVLLQEHMKRHHGVKKVVHQKSWQLVEALIYYSTSDKIVSIFSEFLDGTRNIDELSFYLYCSSVLSLGVAEESQALPPARFLDGYVSFERATAITTLLFGDLKALPVLLAELEKCARIDSGAAEAAQSQLETQGFSGSETDYIATITRVARCIMAGSIFEILLEGWRMSALLLDNHKSIPGFSWRKSTLAFIQADKCHRGWLDPHEVKEAETRCFGLDAASGIIAVDDRTSFGAFIFRAVQRCSASANSIAVAPPVELFGTCRPQGAAEKRKLAQRRTAEAVLKVSSNAFDSVQQSLQAYLTWMMHSSELRDLAVYRSLKAHIYSFEQALGNSKAAPGAHSMRSLLLLLLAHQFDVQYQQENICPEHLDWEMRSLLQVLRESWRRAAMKEAGPEFGTELQSLGDPSPTANSPRMLPLPPA